MIGTATIYSIILIQFEMAANNNNKKTFSNETIGQI